MKNKLFGVIEKDAGVLKMLLYSLILPFYIFSNKTKLKDKIRITVIYTLALVFALYFSGVI